MNAFDALKTAQKLIQDNPRADRVQLFSVLYALLDYAEKEQDARYSPEGFAKLRGELYQHSFPRENPPEPHLLAQSIALFAAGIL